MCERQLQTDACDFIMHRLKKQKGFNSNISEKHKYVQWGPTVGGHSADWLLICK